MLEYISEHYKGDERTYFDKDGDEIVSSYRMSILDDNASVFDTWVVLNSLDKEITHLKMIRTAIGQKNARGFRRSLC